MTPEELLEAGCLFIHWNPNYRGGWFEYYIPINVYPLERLSVHFDGDPRYGRDFMVFLHGSGTALAIKQVVTVAQFLSLAHLLKGVPDA